MTERIQFGSLETQERQSFLAFSQGTQGDLLSTKSNSTILPLPPQLQSLQEEEGDTVLNEKEQELRKAIRRIKVTTIDAEVKQYLRQLNQPVCYFGENSFDRRERLKTSLGRILIETGEIPIFQTRKSFIEAKDDENEHFFYEGPKDLRTCRIEIAKYSFKRAGTRVLTQKIKRLQTDPLDDEAEIDREVQQACQYEAYLSQFADSSAITRGQFAPNQEYFGTCSNSGEAQIWSIPDCELKYKLLGHFSKLHDIAFHPESTISLSRTSYANIATASSDTTIRLWNFKENEFDEEVQDQNDFQLSPTLKNTLIYNKSITLQGHDNRVNRLKFHPNGKYLFSTSHDKTWRFWDLETQKSIFYEQTGHIRPVYALSQHPDGSLLFTGDFGGFGALWDLRTGKHVLSLLGHVKGIISADFCIDGYHLITGSEDNMIRVWDIRRKNCVQIIPAHLKLVSDLKFEPNNSKYFMSVSYDTSLKVWSTKDWGMAKKYEAHESKISSLSISNNRKYLATTSVDRKWMLWVRNENLGGSNQEN